MPQDATRISAWHEDKICGYYDSEKRWQILHPDFLQDGRGGGGPTCLKISPLLIYKKVQLYGHSQGMHNSLQCTKTIIFLAF